jgi:hypothetical protein
MPEGLSDGLDVELESGQTARELIAAKYGRREPEPFDEDAALIEATRHGVPDLDEWAKLFVAHRQV